MFREVVDEGANLVLGNVDLCVQFFELLCGAVGLVQTSIKLAL